MTGYPSIDKSWLKYYTKEQVETPIPACSLYEYLYEKNKGYIVVNEKDQNSKDRIEKELQKMCEDKLPSYSRPTYYEFIDKLPLTVAGKVDYLKLENMAIR